MSTRTVDGMQGLVALIGITLGVIPLVRAAYGGGPGWLLGWLPGMEGGATTYVVPIVIVVVAVAVMGVLERSKRMA